MGQERKSGDAIAASELPLKADIERTSWEVRKVPNSEVAKLIRLVSAVEQRRRDSEAERSGCLRLITSSNLVGCSIGRSCRLGLLPDGCCPRAVRGNAPAPPIPPLPAKTLVPCLKFSVFTRKDFFNTICHKPTSRLRHKPRWAHRSSLAWSRMRMRVRSSAIAPSRSRSFNTRWTTSRTEPTMDAIS